MRLDHTQRLNIEFIIGQQRGCTVEDLRLCWSIMDHVKLNADELRAINYRKEQHNGNLVSLWDGDKSIPLVDCELPDDEQARIVKAINEWPHGYAASDRTWLEPLLSQLTNGQPKTEVIQ